MGNVKTNIEKFVSPEKMGEFHKALEKILIDNCLKIRSKQASTRLLNDLVNKEIIEPASSLLKSQNESEGIHKLYVAYCDVLFYGNSIAQASADAGVDSGDLAWLIGKKPFDTIDMKKFKPDKELKKLRTPKKTIIKKSKVYVDPEEDDSDD